MSEAHMYIHDIITIGSDNGLLLAFIWTGPLFTYCRMDPDWRQNGKSRNNPEVKHMTYICHDAPHSKLITDSFNRHDLSWESV